MNLRDLLDDILRAVNYNSEDLDSYSSTRDEISGSIKSDKPALLFCLPLQDTSYRDNVVSELNNTVVLSFDHIVINDITSKVGIFISSSEGVINIEARILGYYVMLDDGKVFLASSWKLYTAIISKEAI